MTKAEKFHREHNGYENWPNSLEKSKAVQDLIKFAKQAYLHDKKNQEQAEKDFYKWLTS